FAAYGWHTQKVDGHNPAELIVAIEATKAETERPSIIACRTHIGFGSPHKQDTSSAHGSPLGDEEIRLTKQALNWPTEPLFYVAEGAKEMLHMNGRFQSKWEQLWESYLATYPEDAALYQQYLNGVLPSDWSDILPTFEADKSIATRASSGQVLNAIAPHVPYLLGGSADLTGSNKTDIKGEKAVTKDDFSGRYIYFGVREHAMGSIMNGMFLHGGIRPYGGTFLVFSDYMRPAIRMAALMGVPAIYVFTHDSIGLGTDGPTHQPIEHVMSLRAIPNLTVIRPADANETAVAWQSALQNLSGPTALILTRQGVPTLDRNEYATADGAAKGAYVLCDAGDPEVILLATGSEVHIALSAQMKLAAKGVAARAVSMPSWEIFAEQTAVYQESVLPRAVTARVSIEAGVTLGWERYLGCNGIAIGLDRYGASAPYKTIYEKLGLTSQAMADAALSLLG
ncbi:Transketolase, partial [hydrothermal vent metagenome]